MANEPPDFISIRLRAAAIVKDEPMLAYAVSNALRKNVVGYKIDSRYQMVMQVLAATWNRLCDLQTKTKAEKYNQYMIELAADAVVTLYDVLTDSRPEVKK